MSIKLRKVTSTTLEGVRYDAKKKELEVVFLDGSRKVYAEVPKEAYELLLAADGSKDNAGNAAGKYYHWNIRKKFKEL